MSEKLLRRLFPEDLHHVDGLHDHIARMMPARGQVLDLGCGANSELARYRSREREVWGADFAVHSQMTDPEWFRPLGARGEIPFPDASFDLVVAVMVLEHVSNPRAFLAEVARVLRPGGGFVAHTISGTHYVTFIRRVLGLLPHRFTQVLVRKLYGREPEDTFPTHYALNRVGQLERAFETGGFAPPSITRYADPWYFRFLGRFLALAVVADWALEHIGGGWGRLYFTVTTTRKPAAPSTPA